MTASVSPLAVLLEVALERRSGWGDAVRFQRAYEPPVEDTKIYLPGSIPEDGPRRPGLDAGLSVDVCWYVLVELGIGYGVIRVRTVPEL